RTVHKIKGPDSDKILTQPKDITEAFASYYRRLYEEEADPHKNERMESFFKSIKLAKLTSEEANMLSLPITEEEIRENIVKLKNNRAPGINGFSGEYYKAYVNE